MNLKYSLKIFVKNTLFINNNIKKQVLNLLIIIINLFKFISLY